MNLKNRWVRFLIFLGVFFVFYGVFSYFSLDEKLFVKHNTTSTETESSCENINKKVDLEFYNACIKIEQLDKELEERYSCYFEDLQSTPDMELCYEGSFSRAREERKWKQIKLENLPYDEVAKLNGLGSIEEEGSRAIHAWRESFDEARDSYCSSEYAFQYGSGMVTMIASCKLNYEIESIKLLNSLFYSTLNAGYGYSVKNIPDFELY